MKIKTEYPSAFINTVSKPLKRRCSRCGEHYYRVNKLEQWTGRSPGKRLGWHKDIARVCTNCQGIKESLDLMEIADVQFSKKAVVRRKN